MNSIPHRSVTLFFPMFNEHDSLQSMIEKVLEVLPTASDDFEILIIDDGSSDGSEQIADELVKTDPHLRVIHHQGNKGYGQALRTGFASASKDIVMYTDCDQPFDLDLIPKMLDSLQGYDMLIGYRVNRWEGVRRSAYSKVYNLL